MTNLNTKVEFRLIIETCKLKAFLNIMPKNDVRYYLNGLAILKGKSENYLCATNGHYLMIAKINPKDIQELEQDIIIPYELLKLACSQKIKISCITKDFINGIKYDPIDGQFPKLHQVIPNTVSGEKGNYNPEQVALCQKALRLYSNDKNMICYLHHNGSSQGILTGKDASIYCLIMPVRDNCIHPEIKHFTPDL